MTFLLRGIDIALAMVGLFFLAPVFAMIALVVHATSPGPVIVETRARLKDDSTVSIRQFRTWDVDTMQETRLGRSLRKLSLDLLPALTTILQGKVTWRDLLNLG